VLGIILSLLSAATFAFNNASARRGVLSGSVLQALAITVPIGVPMFFAAALLSGNLGRLADFSAQGLQFLAAAGVLHFIVGRYGNYRASKAIGVTLSAPIVQLNLIVTLALAVTVLDERLTPLRIAGIALVILGATLMRQGERARAERDAFRPAYAEGYFFGLLAAAGYGVTPILVRAAIGGGGPGAALCAGVVSYAAATLALALYLLWPGQLRHALAAKPEAVKWFTYSGVFVCVSQILVYMAYSLAPLTVVVPIQQLSLVFRYIFARMLTPEHEVFGGKVIVGTALSLIGAVSISASTDFVLSLVTLPPALVDIVRWQWP
jgi:drug/metabolite transporter (DMT)-like permease